MLEGQGFFAVATPHGERYTRNGSFILGMEGILLTKDGFPVLGENGPIRITENNTITIDPEGRIWLNSESDPVLIDILKIVEFELDRFLEKQGNSLYRESFTSGPAMIIGDERRPRVLQGFLEASNVDPVVEMVQMIEVNRAYEANQKMIQTEEQMLGTLINQVAKFG
jgi:flagellar basal-body rod protein FlgG